MVHTAPDLDTAVSRVEASLGELLRLTSSERVHASRVAATGVAITRTQLRLLSYLVESGQVSVTTLARLIDVSQPTASRSLRQLELAGLVRRTADPNDGRVAFYAATAKGRRARARIGAYMRDQLCEALGGMGSARSNQLADLLSETVKRLLGTGRQELDLGSAG